MNRIRAITALKDSVGPTAVDAAIEAIRDYRERWGLTAEPEEDALTREILGTLIDLQVRSVERAVRLGEAMSRRLTAANDVQIEDEGPYCLVPLTRGHFAKVDVEDFADLCKHKWFALQNGASGTRFVAARTVSSERGRQAMLMHRMLLNAGPGEEVDHINRDPLDNRRSNLRLATRSQNCANTHVRNSTGYRGVSWSRNRYQAEGFCNHERHYLGRYETAEEAARAYDAFARKHHGAFAVLNFPATPDTDPSGSALAVPVSMGAAA